MLLIVNRPESTQRATLVSRGFHRKLPGAL